MRDLDQLQLQQLADHLLDLDSGSGEGLLLKRIAARIEALEAMLRELNTLIDFEEPITDDKPMVFGDVSAINAVMAKAYAVLCQSVTCPSCGGEGRELHGHPNDPHPKDYGPCEKCHGEGRVGHDSV